MFQFPGTEGFGVTGLHFIGLLTWLNQMLGDSFYYYLMVRKDSQDRSQPKLYPWFNVGKLIPERETERNKKERNFRKGWKELLQRKRKKKSQTKEQTQWHGTFITKAKEWKPERIFCLRWCPASPLEANEQSDFFLTIKWMILKLCSYTGRIKLVWLGLGWVITSHSRTLHRQAEPNREDEGGGLKSRCGIPMAIWRVEKD